LLGRVYVQSFTFSLCYFIGSFCAPHGIGFFGLCGAVLCWNGCAARLSLGFGYDDVDGLLYFMSRDGEFERGDSELREGLEKCMVICSALSISGLLLCYAVYAVYGTCICCGLYYGGLHSTREVNEGMDEQGASSLEIFSFVHLR
jgi:hypothetical protein